MVKEITFKGKTEKELIKIEMEEFIKLIPSRQRRSLTKGLKDSHKKLMKKISATKLGTYKKTIKTHCRDMVIVPEMIGLKILIYNGKAFSPVVIDMEMLGHYLGEFANTRSNVKHSAPGIGATRSSAYQSVK